ncbi:MAG: hypothetical protein ACKVOR_08310 [Flavobacteriales bacterium]
MKQYFRKHLMLLLLATAAVCAYAQPDDEPLDGPRKERIAQLKKTFYTERLALTDAEAEKFWPVYDEYIRKRDALKKEIRKAVKTADADSTISEQKALDTITLVEKKRKEEVELDTKFLKDCMPILGAKRTMLLAHLEREFQKAAMQKIREKRQNHQGKQGGLKPGRKG